MQESLLIDKNPRDPVKWQGECLFFLKIPGENCGYVWMDYEKRNE
jgi:hypothetical protein